MLASSKRYNQKSCIRVQQARWSLKVTRSASREFFCVSCLVVPGRA